MFGRKKKSADSSNETLNSLRKEIHNYSDYDDVKNRDKTDRALRKYLYDIILELIDAYTAVQNHLMQGQLLSTWSASNQILTLLNELRTLLTSDVYRHSTFFETPDVSENIEISIIYLLESETILSLRAVLEKMKATAEKLANLDLYDIEKDIYSIKSEIDEIHQTISDRAELIASFEIVGL